MDSLSRQRESEREREREEKEGGSLAAERFSQQHRGLVASRFRTPDA
jgi:hypothetical protein